MKIGLEFNLDNPAKYGIDTARLYGFMLEMCEEADHLGVDWLLFSEHHGWVPRGHLTQPLVYAAAVAARTKRARIGTGITIGPLRHPLHLAEEVAVVDLISNGRFELGLGAGYRIPEYELFDQNRAERYDVNDQRARELRALWAEGLTYPMPVQERVPIWLGYQGPKGARRAGLLGEGLLCADAALWEPYRAGLVEGGHDVSIGRMAGAISAFITPDPERDWVIVRELVRFKWDLYRRLAVEGQDRPAPKPVDPDRVRARDMSGVLRFFVHDTPEGAAAKIKNYVADAPVETILIDAPLAGMSEALIAQFIQTVGNDLAPLVRDM